MGRFDHRYRGQDEDRGSRRDAERRRRSRSRSPHRTKRRSRSPRDRKRRSRSPRDKKKRPGSSDRNGVNIEEIVNMTDKEMAEKTLEDEMTKRRERIEEWRQKRKQKEDEREKRELDAEAVLAEENQKKWSLDDEDEDDEAEKHKDGDSEKAATSPENEVTGQTKEAEKEAEVEVDPLDAFMQEVNQEVRQINHRPSKASAGHIKTKTKVVVVTKIASQDTKTNTSKGIVLEQNADAMEYSDEEKEQEFDSNSVSLATKAKQLPITDHNKVYYRPFRRDFYVEVPEIARMTDEEVTKLREELEDIKIRGKRCPKPVKSWAQCGCNRAVLDILKKHNYEKPTPIQAQAIPGVMSGRDLIGIAKTGSGKTLAFLLPMFRHIMDQDPLEEMDGPIAVVMSPTRELAMQTAKECKKFTKVLGLQAVCVYGGAGISEQIAELKKGCEIVVCTPGRMIDMLAANNGRVTNLRRVTYLVLDEADRMFDMGFEPQVMRIIGNIRPDRQTVLFSATFPTKMEGLARKILQKPVEILIGSKSVVCADIEQKVLIMEEHTKFLKLLELLGLYWEMGSVLVFVEKQEKADELVGDLMKNGYNCAPLHGGIDQFDRDFTIADFKAGRIKLMVATSVAARGLDVKKLILVVNYDCPNHYEDYVHRVGRTGRAGNKGYAYTFILPEGQERYAGDIHLAFEKSNTPIPPELDSLWEAFKQKMKEDGKEIKQGGGFGGHGYKFDEAEAEMVASKKKMEKLVKGLEDENEDEDEIDNTIQSLMKSTKRVMEAGSRPHIAPKEGKPSDVKEDLLEKAKATARQIQLDKNFGLGAKDATQQTAEAIMKGGNVAALNVSAKTIAEQRALLLHEKLNYIPTEEVKEEEVVEHNYYEEELEINDFPQQVRWRVCSRETLSLIQEYSEVGISVKGSYVPPGKQPADGDRRLYLSIESKSELALNRAKAEIVRVLREEMKRMAAQGQQGGPKGRYKVL